MNWYKKAEHDYNPEWDYDIQEPAGDDKVEVDKAVGNLKSRLLPRLSHYPLFKSFDVHMASPGSLGGLMGKYVDGTSSRPVVILDMKAIRDAAEEYNLPVDLSVETTILHELGHAIQDARGVDKNEDQAERFAYRFYNYGELDRGILET